MAFYSSSYDDANSGEYFQTPYDIIHDFFPSEPLPVPPNSSYAYEDYNSFNYDSSPWYGATSYDPYVGRSVEVSHDFSPSESLADNNSSYAYGSCNSFDYNSPYYDPDVDGGPVVSYSSYNIFSEPKYVEYGLDPYGGDYTTVKTRFIVSYSVSDFNEPAFDEYDPTPYGGGYDPDAAYGKALPPSEEICYPRSEYDPNDQNLSNFSYGSIKSPYGKEEKEEKVDEEPVKKPSNNGGGKIAEEAEKEAGQKPQSAIGGGDDNGGSKEKPVENSNENGGILMVENHGSGENEKRVTQVPPGYGLEAMDLCENLFGYWETDCRNCHGICHKQGNERFCCKWEGPSTADYLFGNCYPYGERWGNGGVYEVPMINYYLKHQQQQHMSRHWQVDDHEEHQYSWFN